MFIALSDYFLSDATAQISAMIFPFWPKPQKLCHCNKPELSVKLTDLWVKLHDNKHPGEKHNL